MAIAGGVAVDAGQEHLLGLIPGHAAGDDVGVAARPVQVHGEVGLGVLLAVGHHLLVDDEGGVGAKGGPGGADGGVHALDLGGLHLHIAALAQLHHSGGVHDVLAVAVPLAIVPLDIAHPGVFAHVEGVDAVVLAVLHAAVVDAAAGHDGHVAVVPHEKVVIDQIGQAALAEDHGDVDRLVLGARLDDDVNAVLVGLGHDVDVGGGVPAGLFAVGPDVIGPFGHFMQLGHLL